jgi:GT2 family glycosyltransferase
VTRVSFLIVAYRSRDSIAALLDSIRNQVGEYEREIIIVDNSPAENCAEAVQHYVGARYLLNQSNTGYTRGMNQAIEAASGDYFFLLNPDVNLHSDCTIKLLVELSKNDSVAAAAPQLLNRDGAILKSVRNFPTFSTLVYDSTGLSKLLPMSKIFGNWRNRYFDHATRALVQQPMASALLLKREVWRQVGRMDEQFFVFFSDVDYCKRIHDGGMGILFVPSARATHEVGGSTRKEGTWLVADSHRGFYRYLAKHELRGVAAILRPAAIALLGIGAVVRIVIRKLHGGSFQK